MPTAVIAFDFDPLLRLGDDLAVRWQTVALALAILVCLAAAGAAAKRAGLRTDDLLYFAVGAVPGAVVLGRIGYAIIVPDAFGAGALAFIDPAVGGLELGLGVIGGLVTGAAVAGVLGAPLGRWAHLLAIPLLALLAAGKLTMALGGAGQGAPAVVPWATAFGGPGPWGSLAPDIASHPAQLYEAGATLIVAVVLVVATSVGAFRARDGSRLLVAVAGWAFARVAITTTWRDPVAIGPLPAGGILALAIGCAALVALATLTVWLPRRRRSDAAAAVPAWPDPGARPRF